LKEGNTSRSLSMSRAAIVQSKGPDHDTPFRIRVLLGKMPNYSDQKDRFLAENELLVWT
jgi:hypothetical protein